MKTKISRISKRSISLLLSILMIVSMMLVGMVTTSAANGTITVYFKNTVGWSNVYVYFYPYGNYWNDNGTGSKDTSGGQKMSLVSGTSDIYSYTYTGNYSTTISFVETKQDGYDNFYQNKVTYRTDFNTSNPMFTPNTTSNETRNSCSYFSNGSWSTYTPASTNWYLGGYINEKDIGVGDPAYKFSSTSTANVYELEITFTSDHNNGQYITINNGTSIYGTGTDDETLAENATDTSDYQKTGKWFVPIPAGTKVKFKWNASTNTISWSKVSTSTSYTVTVSAGSNGSAYISKYTDSSGTVVSNSNTSLKSVPVKSGTTVTMTAVPNANYAVSSWNGSASTSTTYTTGNITSNTTVTVTFSSTGGGGESGGSGAPAVDKSTPIDGLYLIYGTSNDPASMTNYIKLYKVNGEAIAYFSTDVSNFKTDTTYYFALSSQAGGSGAYQHMYWQSWAGSGYTSFNVTKNNSDLFDSCGTQDYNRDDKAYKFPTFRVSAITQDVQISVGKYGTYVEGNTYDIRAYSSLTKAIKIYAKDGTIRANYQKYAHIADTTFTDTTNLFSLKTSENQREEAYADVGTTITVQTTIEPDSKNKYYVKAFSVNGACPGGVLTPNDEGVYTLQYTIPDDFEGNSIEITPIYFYIDNTDMITFYVENFDDEVKEQWGDTIACHAYYENVSDYQTTDEESGKNALGGYPGQPMVIEGSDMFMQIPRYLNGDRGKPFKGITLNNYVWDDVHAGRAGGTDNNCQTYDFNDLYCIANVINGANNIIFRFKYSKNHENQPNEIPTDDNKERLFTNGWEDLTDYYSKPVDLFGKILNETEQNRAKLRIVSNGYIDNHIGDYATEWNVYKGSGDSWTKVATLPSSVLLYPTYSDIPSEASNYSKAYQDLEAYRGYPVEITYERSTTGGYERGDRCDGRWYYSFEGDEINANTIIEYAPTINDTFVQDTYVKGKNIGSITNTKAYFTNDEFYGKTEMNAYLNINEYFTLNAENDDEGKYVFIGWYSLVDGKYFGPLTEPKSPMSGDKTFVARFIERPKGMLSISHRLYKFAPYVEGMPEVHTGTGICYLTVDVIDANGKVLFTENQTDGFINIPDKYVQYASTYKIKVSLKTKINGLNKFNAYYVNEKNTPGGYFDWTTEANKGATGETTRELNFNVSDLFGLVEGVPEFIVPSIDFYSDILSVAKEYKIKFNYFDRFNNAKFYVVKGTLTEEYMAENVVNGNVVLTNDFIMSKAPYEDNFGSVITWKEESITTGTSGDVLTANVSSDSSEHDVVVNYRSNPDVAWEDITLPYGSLVVENDITTGKEKYVCVAEPTYKTSDGTILLFSHWEVYTDSKLTNLVTKCYSREFNYIAYDNYYIEAKYLATPEKYTESGATTTITFLEYSRNQWTDEEGNKTTSTDKLYADFNLTYNYNGQLMNDMTNVECGLALEVCGKLVQSSDGSYITDLGNYSYATDEEALKNAILNGTNYSYDGDTRNVIKHTLDNKDLTNKNRIEVYRGFNNSTANPLYVIKCYSYMIIDGTDVVLSAPVYINLYDVANLTYTVS